MTILTEGKQFSHAGWTIEMFETELLISHPEISEEPICLGNFEDWSEGLESAKQHIDRGNFHKGDYGFFRVCKVTESCFIAEILTESSTDWQTQRFEDELEAIAWTRTELDKAAKAAWTLNLAEHLQSEGLISEDEYWAMLRND